MITNEIKAIVSEKDPKEFRKFGLTMGIFFFAVGLFAAWYASEYSVYLLMLGGILIILGWLVPIILKPFFMMWMIFAILIGSIMTRLILSAIFYLVFTPFGLILRILKKDLLDQKIDPKAESYWKVRSANEYDPVNTEKQF